MKQKEFNFKFVEAISTGNILQDDLLSQIKNGPVLNATRALEVYREDYESRLTDALKNTYRGIHSLIGDEDFLLLVKDYIRLHSSNSSDLDDYGSYLSYF